MPLAMALISPVSELAKTIINKIWPPQADPNERVRAEAELTQLLEKREHALIGATKSVIVAEMQSGDNYTKRARPSVVYSGLLFIGLVHVVFPIVAFFTSRPMPELQLPTEFWWAWGSVVSVWSFGRTMERRGAENKLTKAITG